MRMTKNGRHPTKGRGPFRSEFWSICSKHYIHRPECIQCSAGRWHNITIHHIDAVIWAKWPRISLWWHNRPNSKAKRTLRSIFPKLS